MDFLLDDEPPRDALPPIDFRAELNDEQYAAVTAPPGPVLVLAGAGSGKTRTLTYRVAWLLAQGVPPDRILLLTFTNKAAKEMLHRVEDLTGIAPHRFWGGTFHSIGHRLLRANAEAAGLARGFTILDADEAETFLRDTVNEIDKAFFKDKAHPKPGPLAAIVSLARNTCQSIARTLERQFPQHEHLTDRIARFAVAYRERKRTQAVVDYDDLLEGWLELLESHPHLAEHYRRRFEHILVDEYQDTNTLQARIVDHLGAHHRLMVVGDDAQCIYSWRGANFENILTFPDRHPATAIHRIETNYRSVPGILELANQVLAHQPRGRFFEKELRPARPAHGRPCVIAAMDPREQAHFVVTRVRGLVGEGRRLRDIAILYRAHYQALELQLELTRLDLPFHITSGVRFFESAHVKDLTAILRFVYNPQDTMAFQRFICLLPKVGDKNAQKLHALGIETARRHTLDFPGALAHPDVLAKVPAGAREEWPKIIESLVEIAEAARTAPPTRVVELAVDGWYGDYLRGAYPDYLSRLDDLKALVGFAGRFSDLADLLAQIVLLTSETSHRQVEPDDDALRLTTVHQAKGLEFDVVFIIGLADGLFPLRRAIEEDNLEEERRLFYVGVTRARDELYLVYPRFGGKGGGVMNLDPSRFVTELPGNLYEQVRLRRSWDY
jgi:DNA helicase-2/ATP-dependent DNA helicase PcrA